MSDSIAVILGSAFSEPDPHWREKKIATPFGEVSLFDTGLGWALMRHGAPHKWLPNQIPYRAHAAALKEVGVGSVLITSSVGVLDPEVPLFMPMMVDDLIWFENRLPDGTACTMWPEPTPEQGHLVIEDGLFNAALSMQILEVARDVGVELAAEPVTFWYAPGPRTKTAAENHAISKLGAQVNSMTLAPEAVLLNELEMSVAGVVVGHKASGPGMGTSEVRQSLDDAKKAVVSLVRAFLRDGEAEPFANHIYRYS